MFIKVEKLPALAGIPTKLWVFCLTKVMSFLKKRGIFKENPKVPDKNWWPVPNLDDYIFLLRRRQWWAPHSWWAFPQPEIRWWHKPCSFRVVPHKGFQGHFLVNGSSNFPRYFEFMYPFRHLKWWNKTDESENISN